VRGTWTLTLPKWLWLFWLVAIALMWIAAIFDAIDVLGRWLS